MRILLAIVTAAAAAVFISGCEKLWGSDGYTWYRAGPPASSYTWRQQESQEVLDARCGYPPGTGMWGCAYYDFAGGDCLVLSRWIEVDAKKQVMNGRDHFDHEVGPVRPDGSLDPSADHGHCAGFKHREQHVRGT